MNAYQSEAQARIKINKLLEEASWRFFDDEIGQANIVLEPHVKIEKNEIDKWGNDFENIKSGYIDFLLLDKNGKPLVVLEAKRESIQPLSAKEQARDYADSQNVKYVLLSNGNSHYFWDIQTGNPEVITRFPSQDSITTINDQTPNPNNLVFEEISHDFIALTQMPHYASEPLWQDSKTKDEFIENNNLRFLRPYQINAIKRFQEEVKKGGRRFLFEMATGTGKTLVAAAIIKLFFKSGNANRILFLVDRLELEYQAHRQFTQLLRNDLSSVIYKDNKSDWKRSEIVVTTIQSLFYNDKYRNIFSPTDFELIISDEAHRSIGGNSRAIFEYFLGYKLGLTATPKDYLKNLSKEKIIDLREYERRVLLDTYITFGCESGLPTFRYSLLDGVRDGYLVNPIVCDARTDITTQLLLDQGYSVMITNEEGQEEELTFIHRDFEKRFFSEETNYIFCKTFIDNALRDPISGEIGKSIVFCVSQKHAAKITQILNEIAHNIFDDYYSSDFAMQITSDVSDAQNFTIRFKNNNLRGTTRFLDGYLTSKTRICVTVGMMTTGYDCEDILNIAMMRPIFSPTDFIQIKGRGTRKYKFIHTYVDEAGRKEKIKKEKETFKLFDYFGNCEFFEEKYNYDEIITLPPIRNDPTEGTCGDSPPKLRVYENLMTDPLKSLGEKKVGLEGMKIDRMFFQDFKDIVRADQQIVSKIEEGEWNSVESYIESKLIKSTEYNFTLKNLRRSLNLDRDVTLREILEHIFFDSKLKNRDELMDGEFEKFVSIYKPESSLLPILKYFFRAYIEDHRLRETIKSGEYADLNILPSFSMSDFKELPVEYREIIPQYIDIYVSITKYAA